MNDTTNNGGRESVEDALAIVESFGQGIGGLNDTYARQILLAKEVKRLREARAPADSVLEDAARYQWLRRWKGQEHEPPFTVQHEIDGTLWGGDLDAAIDAAMNKGGV